MTENKAAGSRSVARTPSDPEDRYMEEIQTSANTDISHIADRSHGLCHFLVQLFVKLSIIYASLFAIFFVTFYALKFLRSRGEIFCHI